MANYANRGMSFESLLDYTNRIYEQVGKAIVNKRPTPVKVNRLSNGRIKDGWFDKQSTVDYDGVYKGRSIVFEAKSTRELTRFDLKNIHEHQVDYLKKCHEHGAISFILVEFINQRKTFLLPYESFEGYWKRKCKGGAKSIAFEEFEHTAYEVPRRKVPVDYLEVVQNLWSIEVVG